MQETVEAGSATGEPSHGNYVIAQLDDERREGKREKGWGVGEKEAWKGLRSGIIQDVNAVTEHVLL